MHAIRNERKREKKHTIHTYTTTTYGKLLAARALNNDTHHGVQGPF